MTPKEAKALTLEVWIYLRDNPYITTKYQLPVDLWEKIKLSSQHCSLCDLYRSYSCILCPLSKKYSVRCEYYNLWNNATTDEERQEAAAKIVELVSAWEPEE
jgi:hypothetical protein